MNTDITQLTSITKPSTFMQRKNLGLLLFIIILLQSGIVSAQNVRTYSNEFLSLGVGARALGMGNAQTAVVNDVTAGYWNPAGLNGVESTQFSAMHAEWFAGISKYDYLGIAIPIADNSRTIGISALRFGIDDIPNTLALVNDDGSINYDNVSAFSSADYGFLFSYAQELGPIRLGANAKLIHRRAGSFARAWGIGLDLGAQYAISEDLTLGVTLRDFPVSYNSWAYNFTAEEKEILQLNDNIIPINTVELTASRLIVGGAYNWQISDKIGLLSALDFDFTFDGKRNTLIKSNFTSIAPRLGLEFNYDQFIYLRAGFNNMQQFTNDTDGSNVFSIQPNLGLGIRIKELSIDYAFTGLNRVGDSLYSNIISLRFDLKSKNNY